MEPTRKKISFHESRTADVNYIIQYLSADGDVNVNALYRRQSDSSDDAGNDITAAKNLSSVSVLPDSMQ